MILLFCFVQIQLFGQSKIHDGLKHLRSYELDELDKLYKTYEQLSVEYNSFKWYHGVYTENFRDTDEIVLLSIASQSNNLSFEQSSLLKITLGDYFRIKNSIPDLKALILYEEVLEIAKKEQDSIILCEVVKRILHYHSDNGNLYNYEDYINLHRIYCYDELEKNINTYFSLQFKISEIYQKAEKEEDSIDDLQVADSVKVKMKNRVNSERSRNLLRVPDSIFNNAIKRTNNLFLKAQFVQLKGVKYFYADQKKRARSLYNEVLQTYRSIPNNAYAKGKCFGLLMNKGSTYLKAEDLKTRDFKKAKDTLLAAQKLIYYSNSLHQKVSLQRWLKDVYDSLGMIDSAYYFSVKRYDLKEKLNQKKQTDKVFETREAYKNVELRAENLEEKAITSKKNTQLIISLFVLALVIITAYLLQKNTRKKQQLAEQVKDLEAQKVVTLLKEQELASIDAMIEGQEKERKRIAEDLHDDLGALMATINLHLENVGSEKSPNALEKTKALLGEAYNKIRNISHVKNAGVIANQGLLVAVQNMASKISSASKIDIEVIAHGLENRLESSLELSLFRTIQELMTNIIKHAEATKASIELTQFEDSLNIIVQDYGKGFDASNNKATGIGLNNIKKRIQHLDGTFTIDSTIGKGTTILIDIPLSS